MIKGDRLRLPQVTLCAVTSINVAATLRALAACLEQVSFKACKLLTDMTVDVPHPDIEVVRIARLESSRAYSRFLLSDLVDFIDTSHCLVTQWDGHVVDAHFWRPAFLDFDYIGATWPQFTDGYDVGNGGFSLRSRALMALCRDSCFSPSHPEDVAIGRVNRVWLEQRGMKFAPAALADVFATERQGDLRACFGFHGVWNMPGALGSEAFWQVYRGLDEHSTLKRDFWSILQEVHLGPHGYRRSARMIADRLFSGSWQ